MRVIYRDHEINVTREKSLGGWSQIFFSIFRLSDWYECDSGFSESSDTVRTWVGLLKKRIDAELAESDPWMEKTGILS